MDHFCICDSIYRFKTEFAGTLDGMIFNFHDGRPGLSRKWHYHNIDFPIFSMAHEKESIYAGDEIELLMTNEKFNSTYESSGLFSN